jgi:hypothetical protein
LADSLFERLEPSKVAAVGQHQVAAESAARLPLPGERWGRRLVAGRRPSEPLGRPAVALVALPAEGYASVAQVELRRERQPAAERGWHRDRAPAAVPRRDAILRASMAGQLAVGGPEAARHPLPLPLARRPLGRQRLAPHLRRPPQAASHAPLLLLEQKAAVRPVVGVGRVGHSFVSR